MTVWLRNRTPDISELLQDPELAKLPHAALRVLAGRGFTKPEQAHELLTGELADLHDPRLLKDAELAVSIIKQAIHDGLNMVIFGDYDSDGVTSVTVMMELLEKAGGKVNYWTNNRFVEGYGINPLGVDNLLAKFPNTDLIITVDNGISGYDGVNHAVSKGIRVVVTDHHDATEKIPNAEAVVNPKRLDCTYPFKELCGAGVAFKLMCLLYEDMGLPVEDVYALLDVVAVGTVADVMPIIHENRIIVREGLKRIETKDREVFSVLSEINGGYQVTAETIGFSYGPMINAVGRLDGTPSAAIDMFLSKNPEEIREKALYLKEVNDQRKSLTRHQVELAEKIMESQGLDYINIVYHPDFHEGLSGLVAGRLKEKYNRPFFVLADNVGFLKGSGRGIEGFDLKKAMDKIADVFIGHGGHEKAAGLSIKTQNIERFKEEMNLIARETLTEEDFVITKRVELALQPMECTVELIESLSMLEPFGEGFRKPVVGLTNFRVGKVFHMGDGKQHVKLAGEELDILMFNGSEAYSDIGEPRHVKALGYPQLNEWRGNVTVQFNVDSTNIRPV